MGKPSSPVDLSGTHLPVLSRLINATSGSVLELGAGRNSTPLLYWTCKAEKRFFRSYENDQKWADAMGDMTEYAGDWDSLPVFEMRWSIVLIDHRPALRRHVDALKFANIADYVVMHDSEPEIDRFYKYSRIYNKFKYVYQYTKIKPNTAILSNFSDPKLIFDLT